MFTGIVQATGGLTAREPRGPGARFFVRTSGGGLTGPLVIGESVAVQGVCLTVQTLGRDGFYCDASAETLARSTLGSLSLGARVHLERALAVGDRLGGHIVTGHVDGKARLSAREPLGEAAKLVFTIEDAELARFVAPKGSVALDGVSLTVNGADGPVFDVVVIPHTLAVTTLGELREGDAVNLEVDLLARYVWRLMRGAEPTDSAKDADLYAKLKAAGIV